MHYACVVTLQMLLSTKLLQSWKKTKPQVFYFHIPPWWVRDRLSNTEKVNVTLILNQIEVAEAIDVSTLGYTFSSLVIHNQQTYMVKAIEDLPVLFYPEQPTFFSHNNAHAEILIPTADGGNEMLTASIRFLRCTGLVMVLERKISSIMSSLVVQNTPR